MKFKVGDLLVKKTGEISIQLVIQVENYYEDASLVKLLDMETKQETIYTSDNISSWLFYKHYPVVNV